MNNKFAYIDENDKCYGLTGMVISLNVLDNDSMLREISLDNTNGESISFTPDFYFSGNPRFSAKIAWNEMIKQYQLLTGMVIGNILCRYNIHLNKSITQELKQEIHHLVEDEGRDICSLEDDEIELLFNKTFSYLSRVYTNIQVRNIANKFVAVIKERRKMTGDEVREEFEYIRQL